MMMVMIMMMTMLVMMMVMVMVMVMDISVNNIERGQCIAKLSLLRFSQNQVFLYLIFECCCLIHVTCPCPSVYPKVDGGSPSPGRQHLGGDLLLTVISVC